MAERDGDKEGETEREEGALNAFCCSSPSRLFHFIIRWMRDVCPL